MNNKDLDLSQITLIDHTALGEENWQDYSITVDPNDIVVHDNMNYDFSDINVNYGNFPSGSLTLDGEDADIVINGKSLSSAITNIESRLAILHCNPELEAEFQELYQLGKQYRKLEKQLLEKQEVWKRLNTSD